MVISDNYQPRLFGINQSNRDFTKKSSWGKNQFNSSFPAALACYMSCKNLQPVYLKLNHDLTVNHGKIDVSSALSGSKTHQYMKSPELTKPRIKQEEINNIILGGGEKLLSPERRFDAIILNTPNLFD